MIGVDPSTDGERSAEAGAARKAGLPDPPREEATGGQARPGQAGDEPEDAGLASLAGQLLKDAEEIGSWLKLLVAARTDRARLRWQETLLRALALAAAALAASALVVTAVVLAAVGLSGALAQVLGAPVWLGQLGVGAAFLAALALGGVLVRRTWRRRQLRRNKAKYDELERIHRERFGPREADPGTRPARRDGAAPSAGGAGTRGADAEPDAGGGRPG